MHLELSLVFLITAGSAVAGCGASAGSAGAAGTSGAGGADGAGGGGSTTGAQTAATSGTGTAAGTSGGAGGGGGVDGGTCADLECGTFGSGCVKCATGAACAGEYQKCIDDAQCKAYGDCVAPCADKGLDCQQACDAQYPKGAGEYAALIHCVICTECAPVCPHAPDVCK